MYKFISPFSPCIIVLVFATFPQASKLNGVSGPYKIVGPFYQFFFECITKPFEAHQGSLVKRDIDVKSLNRQKDQVTVDYLEILNKRLLDQKSRGLDNQPCWRFYYRLIQLRSIYSNSDQWARLYVQVEMFSLLFCFFCIAGSLKWDLLSNCMKLLIAYQTPGKMLYTIICVNLLVTYLYNSQMILF